MYMWRWADLSQGQTIIAVDWFISRQFLQHEIDKITLFAITASAELCFRILVPTSQTLLIAKLQRAPVVAIMESIMFS